MKIGFTAGVFDLFNAGHVLMLEKCKKECDFLIVGIQTDPTIDRPKTKHKPVQSIIERTIEVLGSRYVDTTIVYQTEKDLEDILDTQPINIRFVGMDHKGGFMTGEKICKKHGIEIVYLERGGRFSTSELRRRVKRA